MKLVWVAGRRLSFGMGILAGGAIVNTVEGNWTAVVIEAALGCLLLLGCVNYITVGERVYSANTVTVGDENDQPPPAGKP